MVRRPFLVTAFLSFRHLIRVLSPELQECMDQTKGALLRAHTAEEAEIHNLGDYLGEFW